MTPCIIYNGKVYPSKPDFNWTWIKDEILKIPPDAMIELVVLDLSLVHGQVQDTTEVK